MLLGAELEPCWTAGNAWACGREVDRPIVDASARPFTPATVQAMHRL